MLRTPQGGRWQKTPCSNGCFPMQIKILRTGLQQLLNLSHRWNCFNFASSDWCAKSYSCASPSLLIFGVLYDFWHLASRHLAVSYGTLELPKLAHQFFWTNEDHDAGAAWQAQVEEEQVEEGNAAGARTLQHVQRKAARKAKAAEPMGTDRGGEEQHDREGPRRKRYRGSRRHEGGERRQKRQERQKETKEDKEIDRRTQRDKGTERQKGRATDSDTGTDRDRNKDRATKSETVLTWAQNGLCRNANAREIRVGGKLDCFVLGEAYYLESVEECLNFLDQYYQIKLHIDFHS